jgi:dihydroneopterin aldolase
MSVNPNLEPLHELAGDPVLGQDYDHGQIHDVIQLRDMEVSCIIGCYPDERLQPQPLLLDLILRMPPDLAPDTHRTLDNTFDYARLAGMARFLLQRGRFILLESAALALCRTILAPPTPDAPCLRPSAATVRLSKPRALGGNGIPSVTVTRRAGDMHYRQEHRPFGRVDILHEQPDLGIYRLRVAPGGCIDTSVHRVLQEDELILGNQLLLQNQPVAPGSGFAWPRDHPHRYDNPGDIEQTILCIDRPALFEADEIATPAPEPGLQPGPSETFYVGRHYR